MHTRLPALTLCTVLSAQYAMSGIDVQHGAPQPPLPYAWPTTSGLLLSPENPGSLLPTCLEQQHPDIKREKTRRSECSLSRDCGVLCFDFAVCFAFDLHVCSDCVPALPALVGGSVSRASSSGEGEGGDVKELMERVRVLEEEGRRGREERVMPAMSYAISDAISYAMSYACAPPCPVLTQRA
eukprot:1350309-Rhodomonas_salina.1